MGAHSFRIRRLARHFIRFYPPVPGVGRAIMAAMSTLAAGLLQALKDYGAREIFGIPGDFVLPFYKAIEEDEDPAALYAQPRAGGRLCRRCRRALPSGPWRRGRHLRRRRLQSGQCGGRRLCRALAGRGDRRRAGRTRARRRLPAAPSGAHRRHPARRLSRDHLRPGGARRSRSRARRDRAGVAQRARAVAAGLYRGAARSGGRGAWRKCRCWPPRPADSRSAGRMRRRDPRQAEARRARRC